MASPLDKYIKTVEKAVKVDDGVASKKHKDAAFILYVCMFVSLIILIWGILNCYG